MCYVITYKQFTIIQQAFYNSALNCLTFPFMDKLLQSAIFFPVSVFKKSVPKSTDFAIYKNTANYTTYTIYKIPFYF